MAKDGRLPTPLYVQFVMGVKNAMPVDREVFDFYVHTLKRLAPDAEWCGAGIAQHQITLNEWCVGERRPCPDRARGQPAARPRHAGALERRAGAPGGRALRKARPPGGDSGRGARAARPAGRGLSVAVSPFDSALLGPLFGDAEAEEIFSDAAEVAAMVRVERALARAQGRCGVIPAEAAAAIDAGLADVVLDPAALAAGDRCGRGAGAGARRGAARAAAPEAGQWLHWGATSQDIVDSALALRLDRCSAPGRARSTRCRDTAPRPPAAGATCPWPGAPAARSPRRSLSASASPAGASRCRAARRARRAAAAGRARPVRRRGRHQRRHRAARPGGRRGARRRARPRGVPPWHTDRSALGALAGWCAGVTGALGKMAGDLDPDGPQRERRGAGRRRRRLLDHAAEVEPGRRGDHRRARPLRRGAGDADAPRRPARRGARRRGLVAGMAGAAADRRRHRGCPAPRPGAGRDACARTPGVCGDSRRRRRGGDGRGGELPARRAHAAGRGAGPGQARRRRASRRQARPSPRR